MPTDPRPRDSTPPAQRRMQERAVVLLRRHWNDLERIAQEMGAKDRSEALMRLLERFPD